MWGLPHSLQLGPCKVHSSSQVAIGRLSYLSQPITARSPYRLRSVGQSRLVELSGAKLLDMWDGSHKHESVKLRVQSH
jgi:hypothetical protein